MTTTYFKQLEFFNRYFPEHVEFPDPTLHSLLSDSDEVGSFITDDDYQTIRSNFIDHVYAKNKYLCCQYTDMIESSLEMDQQFHPIQIKVSDLKGWIKG